MKPRIVMTLKSYDEAGRECEVSYELDGTLQVLEQLTTWSRQCAVDFYKQLNDRSEP